RVDYGAAVGAPTAIFRFGLPAQGKRNLWQRLTGQGALPAFQAGDLLGIVPPGSAMPRYYSLGSAARDGFLVVSVRRVEGGLCSGYLHGMQPGDVMHGFVRQNPEFHLHPGKTPVIMVGAGCGVGPLAGFIRANRSRRQIRLYFGARDPDSDFLYQQDLRRWLAEGRLSALVTAFSRGDEAAYLQDKIGLDAEVLRDMAQAGAQIMVVGSRDMGRGVAAAMDAALAPCGLTVARLRGEGRYVEDIY
ncbi:MAG: N-acetylglucosamine transferase, partial [Paracoccaceae bacterium]|nr:N-acetylglucosamine transferase [Paracoccaceae bacterium]